jgi:hypothetical protein
LFGASFLWLGNWNKVFTNTAGFDDLIRDAVIGEFEMPVRLLVGGIQDRIFDDDSFHPLPVRTQTVMWIS